MEKLDRLGWAAGLSLNAFGVSVGVRVNQADALERVKEHLPPGWKPSRSRSVERLYSVFVGGPGKRRGVRSFSFLYANTAQLVRSVNWKLILDTLESDLQLHVAEQARHRLFIHAGVVGWEDRAIVIPGRSFTGKTTLVAELVKAGASYYSDEYALIDSRGKIHPYSKPLSIREGEAKKQKKYRPEALGGSSGVKPLSLGLAVITHYEPGAQWRPRRLSTGQGLLELLANTVSARRQPEVALERLQRLSRQALFFKGARGEAREATAVILKEIA